MSGQKRKKSETDNSCCPPKNNENLDAQNIDAPKKPSFTEHSRWKGLQIGITSGVIASACCIIPIILIVIFVFAGVGSITAALSFTQYRPYFLALGVVFLFLSVYLQIKRKHGQFNLVAVKSDARFLIITATVFAAVFSTAYFIILPGLSQTVYGSLPSSSAIAAVTSKGADNSLAGMHEATLKIGGMYCEGCASAIEYALKEKPGVIRANVSYAKGMGIVIYDPTKITRTEISQTIAELGYAAEIVQDKVR